MPNDTGDKTEAPTPRRRQEAREKGQVASSADLNAAGMLLAAMIALNYAGPWMFKRISLIARTSLGYDQPDSLHVASAITMLTHGMKLMAFTLLPLVAVFVAVGVAMSMAQVGVLFTAEPLQPKLSKISPISGFGRLFSKRSLVRLIMSLFKTALVSVVAWITIAQYLPRMVTAACLPFMGILAVAGELVFILGIRLGLALLILAIFDYVYNRWQQEQDLRMTREEVREEMKRLEGDPLMRERRKRVARQLAMQRMAQEVPGADVVVTNPTELAVAIVYDPDISSAPRVVAKGAGYMAERIRHIAAEHGVPIVERRPLAQALYKTVEAGQEIPPAFYKAVAEILAYVYELSGKRVGQSRPAATT